MAWRCRPNCFRATITLTVRGTLRKTHPFSLHQRETFRVWDRNETNENLVCTQTRNFSLRWRIFRLSNGKCAWATRKESFVPLPISFREIRNKFSFYLRPWSPSANCELGTRFCEAKIEQTCGNSLFDRKLIIITVSSLDEESIIYEHFNDPKQRHRSSLFTHVSTRAKRKAMVRNKRPFPGLTSFLLIFECAMNDRFTACFAIGTQRTSSACYETTAGYSDNKSEMVLSYFWFDLLHIDDCGHWTWHRSDLLLFLDLVSRLLRQWSLDICWYHCTDRFLLFYLYNDLSSVDIHSDPGD